MQVIPVEKCRHGYLYAVKARNFKVGVFDETCDAFVGVRTKFADSFLEREFHCDQGAPFGSAYPLKELKPVPVFTRDVETVLHDYLVVESQKVDIDSLL